MIITVPCGLKLVWHCKLTVMVKLTSLNELRFKPSPKLCFLNKQVCYAGHPTHENCRHNLDQRRAS